jgi:hypothetical protein
MNRRPLLVISASVLLLCLVAIGVREGGRRLRERDAQQAEGLRQLDAARHEMVSSLRRSVENGETVDDPAAQLEDYNARLGRASEHLSDTDRKPVIAGQRVLARLTPLLQTYARELKQLETDGFTAPASLPSRESIQTRSQSVTRFDRANAELLSFYRGVEEAYRAELDKERLSETARTQALEGFRRGANIPLNVTIRETDATLARLMQKTLDLLDKQWGRWHVEESGEVLFDDADALAEFSAVQTELQQTADRQRVAQNELLEATGKIGVVPKRR